MGVVIAAALQLALAGCFAVAATVVWRDGAAAQGAAEAEVRRQGVATDVLARHRIRFAETPAELLLPYGIAVVLVVLGGLNLAGVEAGRWATWIAQPLLLVGGGLVTAGQVFAERFTEKALASSEQGRHVDAHAVVAAARTGFPSWLRALVATRFVLVTAGSVAVLVLIYLS